MSSLLNLSIINNPLYATIAVLALLVLALVIWIIRLEVKFKHLISGKSGSLEESILHLKGNQQEAKDFMKEMEKYLTTVEERVQNSVQSVETVRFNAFDGVGANQSFATALVNEHGDGVVISSLYGRERTSIFSKPLKNHDSEHGLSEEEKQAVKKAKIKRKV